ncbi:MAG: ABC transporter permease, partial [Lachnospiraceae bacterium]|nr:ABC transporter permease [Lachnospiraceae bacterium]
MKKEKRQKQEHEFLRAFLQNKAAVISTVIILLIIILSVLAPFLTRYDETGQDLLNRLMPPGNGHIFGTDELGRDVFTRVFYGTRVSLLIGLFPTALAVVVGTVA